MGSLQSGVAVQAVTRTFLVRPGVQLSGRW